jgi:hypothetical protein
MPLAEAALAQLKAGAMASTAVFARGQITHASYWNIDWPLRTHGCLSGTVVDAAGMPVFGATLFAGGLGYTGSYRPITTGANGRFCLDVQRAEAADEDIDGDLVRGEKNLVSLHVQAGGRNYLLGAVAPAAVEATCGGSCTDLGALALLAEKEVKVALEGHWGGDWGDMLLRKVGDEIWGSYTHDQGTVVLRPSPDGVYRGWWSEAPSRMASADAGEVEFRFVWKDTQLTLDGRWRYGESGAFREDWDLSHLTTPVPTALEARFTDATAFRRHP